MIKHASANPKTINHFIFLWDSHTLNIQMVCSYDFRFVLFIRQNEHNHLSVSEKFAFILASIQVNKPVKSNFVSYIIFWLLLLLFPCTKYFTRRDYSNSRWWSCFQLETIVFTRKISTKSYSTQKWWWFFCFFHGNLCRVLMIYKAVSQEIKSPKRLECDLIAWNIEILGQLNSIYVLSKHI